MIPLLLLGSLFAAASDAPPRKQSAIAPSLPALTKEEEKKIEDVIDRFILADTGRLRGEDAKKAIKEFEKLGPESIPALIRGLNESAQRSYSCPILMITKKLTRFLDSSTDTILLEYARDEIGAGLKGVKHAGVLQDLRTRIMLRKNAVIRVHGVTRFNNPPRSAASMTTAELTKALSSARGGSFRAIVQELSRRSGKEALQGLVEAAAHKDPDSRKIGREFLDAHVGKLHPSGLLEKFTDDRVEVRLSAIRVGSKQRSNIPSLIERLIDENADVRAEARAALKKHSKTEDFGPAPDASIGEQRIAQKKWQEWWENQ